MIDKEHILSEIRRTAEENGGRALGLLRFSAETGIRKTDWSGRYWARWGDALREAGLEGNQLQARIDDQYVILRLIEETRRLGHFPTGLELRLRRREDRTLPSDSVFERLGSKAMRVRLLSEYCHEHPEFADVFDLVAPLLEQSEANSDTDSKEAIEYGSVYLLKSGRYYKLGRTNSFGRRQREIELQLPEQASTVHVIQTDDPPGIEGYWHKRFADRRKNGEWFELNQVDVSAFKRRKFM
jgi:Meiotically up-regulated gene 113